MRHARLSALLVSLALSMASCGSLSPWVDRAARAPALPGFGEVAMPISTASPEAQRWFTHGVLQAYAFNEREAVRSFKAALAADPACALCAWGVAWQLGPNINAVERGDLGEARRYARFAQRLAAQATPLERALADAMAARYADASDKAAAAPSLAAVCGSAGGAGKADPLDLVYARVMRQLVDQHPDDPNLLSLYAEAEMVATRTDWWDRKTGAPAGRIGDLSDRLERLLARHPLHTGLNHYLVHAVDASNVAGRAVAAADRLGALAPASPHLVHMPSHIYVRVGRYADAEQVNSAAVDAQQRLDETVKADGFAQTKNWNGHNQHFLWFAALSQGRSELALRTAGTVAERAAKSTHEWGAYLRGLPLLTMLRFERWADILAATANPADAQRMPGIFEHARGIALARSGRGAEAEPLLGALDERWKTARAAMKPDDDDTRDRAEFMAILSNGLRAELALSRGDTDGAIAAQRAAVLAEDTMGETEPPMLAAGTRQALGRLLLRAGRAADAEAAFRGDLGLQPGNGWALRGLHEALQAQGRRTDAAQVLGDWRRSWSAADAALKPG